MSMAVGRADGSFGYMPSELSAHARDENELQQLCPEVSQGVQVAVGVWSGEWGCSAALVRELDQQFRVQQWLTMRCLPFQKSPEDTMTMSSVDNQSSLLESNQPQIQHEMNHVLDNLEHVLQDLDLVCDELKTLVKDIDRVTGLVEAEMGVQLPLDMLAAHPVQSLSSSSCSSSAAEKLTSMSGCGYESCFEKDLDFDDDELYEMSSTIGTQFDVESPNEPQRLDFETDDSELDRIALNAGGNVNAEEVNTWRSYTVSYVDEDDFIDDDVFISSEHLNSFAHDLEDVMNRNADPDLKDGEYCPAASSDATKSCQLLLDNVNYMT